MRHRQGLPHQGACAPGRRQLHGTRQRSGPRHATWPHRPSFATPGLVRNGKQDVYPFAGDFTTTAQAEGAIEGTASEYEMPSAFATEFAFSRFNAAKGDHVAVEGSKAADIVDASSIERVADPATEEERRRLSEAPCPPPSPPPVPSPPAPPDCSTADPATGEGVPDGWELLEGRMGTANIPNCNGLARSFNPPSTCVVPAGPTAYALCTELGKSVCQFVCATSNAAWRARFPNMVQLMGGSADTVAPEWNVCIAP